MNEKKKQEIPMPFKFDDFFTTQEERDEQMTQTAERMLKMNFEPEKIAIITGLPIEHILKMQDELKTVPTQ